MKRIPTILALLFGCLLFVAADGCSSDPNVEGAKLDLNNKDYDRALENVNKALENNPENAEALALKGDVLIQKALVTPEINEHTALIEEMAEAYAKANSLGQDVSRARLFAYFEEFKLGRAAFSKGESDQNEYANSARYFANASLIQPDSAGAYVNRAYALMNSGDMGAAIEPFEMAIEKGENSVDSYTYLASIYQQEGRQADAISLLEKAEGTYPDDPDIQSQLINLYQVAGMMDRARAKYQANIEREPDNKLYRYNYGSLLLQAEEYDDAIVHLAKAVELDPEYTNAHYNLGAAYQNKAIGIAESMNAIDDDLRANRSNMSAADIQAKEAEIEALDAQKKDNFAAAIAPLEKAKSLTETAGGDATNICSALYAAYVQTGRLDDARAVQDCAGYSDEG